MSGYLELPRRQIATVPIGIRFDGFEPAPRGPGRPSAADRPFTIGYLARIAPEKGLHLLAEAYGILRRERGLGEARLLAAGHLAPEHRGYLAGIAASLRDLGLEGEFRYQGVLDRAGKIAFLRGLDAFSVPSPYAEPKGLYLLEALTGTGGSCSPGRAHVN